MSLLDDSDNIVPPVQRVSATLGGNNNNNMFQDPFASDPQVPKKAPQIYVWIPDYSDGGTYEDNFGIKEEKKHDPATQINPPSSSDVENWDAFRSDSSDISRKNSSSEMLPPPQTDDTSSGKMPWHLTYYSKFFDIDSKDVMWRIIRSLWTFTVNFVQFIKDRPDLYGPFWISTTLIFLMAATGNIAMWIDDRDNFTYDFEEVSFGAFAIYGYMIVIPLALWITLKCLSVAESPPISYLQTLCVYGYSLFIFIPAAAICIINDPYHVVRWAVTMGAGAMSTLFFNYIVFPNA